MPSGYDWTIPIKPGGLSPVPVSQERRPQPVLTAPVTPAPLSNFGEVVPGKLYRGEQPTPDALVHLKAIGVRTIVVLREDREVSSYQEASYRAMLEAEGFRYVVMPIPDGGIPRREQIRRFIQTVDDPGSGPVYVHCAAGIGRTGVMVGLYQKFHGVSVRHILDRCRSFGLVPERRPDLALQATFISTFPLGLLA